MASVIPQLCPGVITQHYQNAFEVVRDPLCGVGRGRELLLITNTIIVVLIGFIFLTTHLIYSWMVCTIIPAAFLKIYEGGVSVLFMFKEVFDGSEDFLAIKHRISHGDCGIVDS